MRISRIPGRANARRRLTPPRRNSSKRRWPWRGLPTREVVRARRVLRRFQAQRWKSEANNCALAARTPLPTAGGAAPSGFGLRRRLALARIKSSRPRPRFGRSSRRWLGLNGSSGRSVSRRRNQGWRSSTVDLRGRAGAGGAAGGGLSCLLKTSRYGPSCRRSGLERYTSWRRRTGGRRRCSQTIFGEGQEDMAARRIVIYSQESREKLVFMVELVFDPSAAAELNPGQPVDVLFGSAR